MEKQKYKCCTCNKEFAQKGTLSRHIRRLHKEQQILGSKNLKCPECPSAFFNRKNILRNHIFTDHKISIDVEEYHFLTFEDFELWKDYIEKKTNCSYISNQSVKTLVSKERVCYFDCHRSGSYCPKLERKRKLKGLGSKKINGCCPSSIDAAIQTDETVKVKFWKTHFGHRNEVGHISLSHEEKYEIAEKIRQGMTFEQILEDARDSFFSCDQLKRIHLLSRRDLNNIIRDFQISKNERLPKEDLTCAETLSEFDE